MLLSANNMLWLLDGAMIDGRISCAWQKKSKKISAFVKTGGEE
jgi:hypothetical protein